HLFNILSEFTTMLRLIFGADFSETYYNMIVQHVITLRDLIESQLANDTEAMNKNLELLYLNADERASYLSQANPNWDYETYKNMINTYIDYTIAEANTFTTSDYDRNVEVFDQLISHTDTMGDYFSLGIYNFIINPPIVSRSTVRRLRMNEQCITYDQMNTIYRLRIFWFDMATWTREYMISRVSGIGSANEAYDRLRKVPIEYGTLLKNYYDSNLVDEVVGTIYRYIDLIDDLISAYQAKNIDEINQTTRQLYQNADEAAALLSKMNPFLNQEEWRAILYGLMSSIIEMVVSFLAKEYTRNISIFNRLLDQSELIGDNFSRGLFLYIERAIQNNRAISLS
ncbi:MAG TPA: hypothetical protein VEA58_12320, partial [Anaerovoracaceae bacterium]|nr:hypothetical protein [Anaerovoracaceae bacterium]